jgi:hypothetical protein
MIKFNQLAMKENRGQCPARNCAAKTDDDRRQYAAVVRHRHCDSGYQTQ